MNLACTMRNACCTILLYILAVLPGTSQQEKSIYGDAVKADVKMKYVYTLEDAFREARLQNKPIFFNCFADWALPCHGMNKQVFSNQEFADYMDKHFVCLFMDLSKLENESIALKYGVKSFAHFLVLDANGDILLRIVGGIKLPEFQEAVSLALNPKTSLPGAEKIYQSGKQGKKELLNYLNVLFLAHQDSTFQEVSKKYIPLLKPKEYARKENWNVISSIIKSRDSELYKYLIEHKADFAKENGEDKINFFFEKLFYWDVLSYAIGQKAYNAMALADLYNDMQKAALPDSCSLYFIHRTAQLRGTKKYDELLEYLKTHAAQLGQSKFLIDSSLKWPDMTNDEKAKVIAYLRAAAKETSSSQARELESIAHSLESNEGIHFESGTFEEALKKAEQSGKLVFMDCYTSWCGPCRMMANQVFTQPAVGDYFNKHFVNLKMDMEKGEGKTLSTRYGVSAYPTLLILDAKGNVLKKIIGAQLAQELLQKANVSSIQGIKK